jgi:hypothetical protein
VLETNTYEGAVILALLITSDFVLATRLVSAFVRALVDPAELEYCMAEHSLVRREIIDTRDLKKSVKDSQNEVGEGQT